MEAVNNPEDASAGTRKVPFSRCFTSNRKISARTRRRSTSVSSPGREVRLRYGYFITCKSVVKKMQRRSRRDALHLRPGNAGGNAPDGRKVKSTIHWVSAAHAVDAEVRFYDKLFTKRIRTSSRRPGFHRESESQLAGSGAAAASSSHPQRRQAQEIAISSSAWDTSARTLIPSLASWFSIEPSR